MAQTRSQIQQLDIDQITDLFNRQNSAKKLRDALTRLRDSYFNLADDNLPMNQVEGLPSALDLKENKGLAATLVEGLRAALQLQIDQINEILGVDDTFLDTLQEIKNFILANGDLLESLGINKLDKTVYNAFLLQYALDQANKENLGVAENLILNLIGGATSAGNTLYKLEQLIADIPIVTDSNSLIGGHHNYRRDTPPAILQRPGMTLGLADYNYILAQITVHHITTATVVEFEGYSYELENYNARILGSINFLTGELKRVIIGSYDVMFTIRRPSGGYLVFKTSSNAIYVYTVQDSFTALVPALVQAPTLTTGGLSGGGNGFIVGSEIFVPVSSTREMMVFNSSSGNYIQTVDIDSLFMSPVMADGLIVGYDYSPNDVTVFDTSTKTVVKVISYYPGSINAITIREGKLFVFHNNFDLSDPENYHYNYKVSVYDIANDYAEIKFLNEMGGEPYDITNTTDSITWLVSRTDKAMQYRFQLDTFYTITVGDGLVNDQETRKMWKHTNPAVWDVFVTNSTNTSIRRIRNGYSTGPVLSPVRLLPFTGVDYIGWDNSYGYVFNSQSGKFSRINYAANNFVIDGTFNFEGATSLVLVDSSHILISNNNGTVIYNQNAQIFPTRVQLKILNEGSIGGNQFITVFDSRNPPVTQATLSEQLQELQANEIRPFLPVGQSLTISNGRQYVVYNAFKSFGNLNVSPGSEFIVASSNGQSPKFFLDGKLTLGGTLIL